MEYIWTMENEVPSCGHLLQGLDDCESLLGWNWKSVLEAGGEMCASPQRRLYSTHVHV